MSLTPRQVALQWAKAVDELDEASVWAHSVDEATLPASGIRWLLGQGARVKPRSRARVHRGRAVIRLDVIPHAGRARATARPHTRTPSQAWMLLVHVSEAWRVRAITPARGVAALYLRRELPDTLSLRDLPPSRQGKAWFLGLRDALSRGEPLAWPAALAGTGRELEGALSAPGASLRATLPVVLEPWGRVLLELRVAGNPAVKWRRGVVLEPGPDGSLVLHHATASPDWGDLVQGLDIPWVEDSPERDEPLPDEVRAAARGWARDRMAPSLGVDTAERVLPFVPRPDAPPDEPPVPASAEVVDLDEARRRVAEQTGVTDALTAYLEEHLSPEALASGHVELDEAFLATHGPAMLGIFVGKVLEQLAPAGGLSADRTSIRLWADTLQLKLDLGSLLGLSHEE